MGVWCAMNKTTDFSYHITKYFGEYLPCVRNFSVNTIRSYRDTFKLFLISLHAKALPSEAQIYRHICIPLKNL